MSINIGETYIITKNNKKQVAQIDSIIELKGKLVYEYNYGFMGFHEGSCIKENISELSDIEKAYHVNYNFNKLPQEFYQSIPN